MRKQNGSVAELDATQATVTKSVVSHECRTNGAEGCTDIEAQSTMRVNSPATTTPTTHD